jgi:hypothetical protein
VNHSSVSLAQALSAERLLARQAAALGGFLGVCAGARLSPLHEPEPITGILILVSAVALAIVLASRWIKQDDATQFADDLILLGYAGERCRTPIDRALVGRIAVIESPRARHRLARDLRWRLRLAAGTARPSPGYIRASAFPPLGSAGRQVFLEEQLRLTRVTDRIDRSQVDPRALVILWRIVTTPPVTQQAIDGGASDDTGAEELRDAVREACRLAESEDR